MNLRSVPACALLAAGCAGFYYSPLLDAAGPRDAVPPAPITPSHPITAAEAAELAVDNSLELRAERETLSLREDAWRLSFRSYLPSLEISAASDERLSTFGADAFTKTLSVGVEQPIWDGGRRSAARALEAAEIDLARSAYRRDVRDVGEAAISAYRSVVAARARLDIKRSSFGSASSEREILAAELRLGIAKASELAEADIALAGMEIEIAEAEASVSLSEAALTESLGMNSLPELTDCLEIDREVVEIDDAMFARAVSERSPDLEAARYGIAKKRAEARKASFSWLPTIGLTASGQASGDSFPLTEATWSIGLSVDFSSPYASGSAGASGGADIPYDSRARSSASLAPMPDPAAALGAREAAVALRLEEDKFERSIAALERNAASALAAYRAAASRRSIGAKALSLAEEKRRLVFLQVGLGQAVRADAVAAELDLAVARSDLIDSLSALVAAERALEKLLDLPPNTLSAFIECRSPAIGGRR